MPNKLSNVDGVNSGHQNLSGRVLVVDDEDALRMIVQMSATMLGLEVVEAENGADALEIARKQHFDVIVSDLMMPEMGGLDLLRTLRDEGFTTPFIVVSGYSDKKRVDLANQLGVFAVIDKPYEIPVFEEILANAIKHRAA